MRSEARTFDFKTIHLIHNTRSIKFIFIVVAHGAHSPHLQKKEETNFKIPIRKKKIEIEIENRIMFFEH